METITFDHDIKLFYITAKSYPEGIMEAHQKLHNLVPFSTDRKYFGISRPEHGVIVYRACAEEIYPGDSEKLNCEPIFLKKGEYICLTIHDYIKDIYRIRQSFETLLSRPDLDPKGYCVEWYFNDSDVRCMIRLDL